MNRKMTYSASIAGLIAIAFLAYAAESGTGSERAFAADATNYTTATVTFGTQIDGLSSKYSIAASKIASFATLSGITSSQISFWGSNLCEKTVNKWSTSYALQIGYPTNWYQDTAAGTFTVTLTGTSYQSVTAVIDTFSDSSNYYYDIPFSMNGVSYTNDGSWGATSGQSQGDCPQFVEYDCEAPKTSLTISIPGTAGEGYDMVFLESLTFHLTK